jgi:RNA polymerase sigma-70 factor (family 1)
MKAETNHADADLVKKLKNNDEDAMIMLYRSYWKDLYISAFRILKDKEVCEDIIQELFIRIWNNRAELNISSSLQAYLSAAVRYEVYRKIRESKKHEPIVHDMLEIAGTLSLLNTLEYKELKSQIADTIETLPEKCREVYNLSRNDLLTHKEISARLAISTKTVRNHLTKALHHLRASLSHMLFSLIVFIFLK